MLDTELKTALDALQGETKTIFSDLKMKYDGLKADHSRLQIQLDAVDLQNRDRLVIPGGEQKTLVDLIIEHPEFKARQEGGFQGNAPLHLSFARSAFAGMERKTNITDATLGFATSGVLMPVRLPGV